MIIASAMREDIRAMERAPEDALSAMLTTLEYDVDNDSSSGVPRSPLTLSSIRAQSALSERFRTLTLLLDHVFSHCGHMGGRVPRLARLCPYVGHVS